MLERDNDKHKLHILAVIFLILAKQSQFEQKADRGRAVEVAVDDWEGPPIEPAAHLASTEWIGARPSADHSRSPRLV